MPTSMLLLFSCFGASWVLAGKFTRFHSIKTNAFLGTVAQPINYDIRRGIVGTCGMCNAVMWRAWGTLQTMCLGYLKLRILFLKYSILNIFIYIF